MSKELEFTPWDPSLGLPCPVPVWADFTVKLRNGEVCRDDCADEWRWDIVDGSLRDYDIIGYHVHKPEPTDTEMLDFLDRDKYEVIPTKKGWFITIPECGEETLRKGNLREAIRAAMKGEWE